MEHWQLNQLVDAVVACLDAEPSRFWRWVLRLYKRRLERILTKRARKAGWR